jgi:hypothetical protein
MITSTHNRMILKIFLIVFVLFVFRVNTFPLMCGNDSDIGFIGGSSRSGGESDSSLRQYVIMGAGYFLESYSDALLFLNKIEMAELNGMDYDELRMMINNAVVNMENARNAYLVLKQLADNTPYNQNVIGELEKFDYVGFSEENGLNGTIFKDVEYYLSKGDIRGVYAQFLANTDNILETLYVVRKAVDHTSFPRTADLQRMNQSYSQSLLFGQYVAEVFQEVKEKIF